MIKRPEICFWSMSLLMRLIWWSLTSMRTSTITVGQLILACSRSTIKTMILRSVTEARSLFKSMMPIWCRARIIITRPLSRKTILTLPLMLRRKLKRSLKLMRRNQRRRTWASLRRKTLCLDKASSVRTNLHGTLLCRWLKNGQGNTKTSMTCLTLSSLNLSI